MVSADNEDADTVAVVCDFCAAEPAVVYCRADSARLCLACDREVHAANTVSSRHNRSLLCDHCAAAPASIFCPTFPHRLVLCSNCDFNAHHADDPRHARHALDPFSGCPSGVCLFAALNVGDEKDKIFSEEDEGWDWESPPVFSWDDLILSPTNTPFHGYQATGMPPPLKDCNSTCGKRKEEIHRQIRQLIIGESDGVDCSEEIVPVMEFTFLPLENLQIQNGSTPVFVETPSCELSYIEGNPMAAGNPIASSLELHIGNSSLASFLQGRDKDEPDPTIKEKPSSVTLKDELPDRSSVISRYKEKRKTRRYDKLIRYESRKSRADSRVRIKGRFARANEVKNL